jgi:hypothetical protein
LGAARADGAFRPRSRSSSLIGLTPNDAAQQLQFPLSELPLPRSERTSAPWT